MSWTRGCGLHPVLPGQLSGAPGVYLHILYLYYHSYIYTFIFIHLHIYIYLCTRDTRRVTACAGRGSPGPAVTSAQWDSGEWCMSMSTFYDVTKSLTPAPGTTRTASRAPARWRARWVASAAGSAGASATSPGTSATDASRASSRSSTPTPRGAQSASATASR